MNDRAAEIVRRGKALYEQQIRPQVEAGNTGKVLVINVDTGEYELDGDHLTASDRAAARFPGAALYAMRIGTPTFGRIGFRAQGMLRPDLPPCSLVSRSQGPP